MRRGLIVGVLLLGACGSNHVAASPPPTTNTRVRAISGASASTTIPAATAKNESQQGPQLQLSSDAGPAGNAHSHIGDGLPSGIGGSNGECLRHDSYNAAHPAQAGDRGLAALERRQVGDGEVQSVYTVTRADSVGRSVIVVQCGGLGGNVVGDFTVTQ